MKTIASLALATLTFASTPALQAHNSAQSFFITGAITPALAPRVVSTKELSRTIESRVIHARVGGSVSYNVMVVKYADYYSNGTTRTYNRTYRV